MNSVCNPEATTGWLKLASCPDRKQEDSDLFFFSNHLLSIINNRKEEPHMAAWRLMITVLH